LQLAVIDIIPIVVGRLMRPPVTLVSRGRLRWSYVGLFQLFFRQQFIRVTKIVRPLAGRMTLIAPGAPSPAATAATAPRAALFGRAFVGRHFVLRSGTIRFISQVRSFRSFDVERFVLRRLDFGLVRLAD